MPAPVPPPAVAAWLREAALSLPTAAPVDLRDADGRSLGALDPAAATHADGSPAFAPAGHPVAREGVPLTPSGEVDVTRYRGRESPITDAEARRRAAGPITGVSLADMADWMRANRHLHPTVRRDAA